MNTRTFFNPTLFTRDKNPMKFYLDGYTNHEVSEIARIIEAFGGKLSSPDENTIIFSEPGRPVTTDNCRYHLQCLYDSIVAKTFQDLEKYRIPVIKEEFVEPVVKETPVVVQPPESPPDPPSLLKPWKIVPVASYADMHERNAMELSKKLAESDVSEGADSESSVFVNNKRIKKKRASGKSKKQSERKSLNQETERLKRKRDKESSDSSGEENLVPNKKRRGAVQYWSAEENRLMIKYLIDNNAIDKARGFKIWEDMESEHILVNPHRSARSIHGHWTQQLQFKLGDYVKDPAVLKQFQKYEKSGKKFSKRGIGKYPGKYPETDKFEIMKYLIDKKAISRAYEKEIWAEMEADGITERHRTAENLRKYFIERLQYDVGNYTSDPDILKEFEKLRIQSLQ